MAREDASTLEIVRELMADLGTLVRQEVALARTEIREELSQFAVVAAFAGGAVALVAVAGIWLLLALTQWLAAALQWPPSGAYAAMGVVLAAIGATLGFLALRKVRGIRVLPKTRAAAHVQIHWPT